MTTDPKYTPAFKLEIAKLMVHEGYSTRQACEASGAGPAGVKRWKKQYQAELAGTPPPAGQALTPEQREIQQLKQHIKQLETERDILKKASAFPSAVLRTGFAREMR